MSSKDKSAESNKNSFVEPPANTRVDPLESIPAAILFSASEASCEKFSSSGNGSDTQQL
jgi:hypothetical protein